MARDGGRPVGSRAARSPAARTAPAILIGRGRERSVLADAMDRLRGGRGGIIVLQGEPGIGKSHLLRAAALPLASESGLQVLVGRVFEAAAHRPFGLIADLLEGHATPALDELLEPRNAAPDRPTGLLVHRIAATVRRRVEELADAAPVLLVAEDTHAGDAGSLAALAELARATRHAPVALVVTRRLHPDRDDVLSLLDVLTEHGATTITLGPLDAEDVDQLIERTVGAAPGPNLVALTAQAGGNPLFVTELLHGLEGEDALVRGDGRAELPEPVLPTSLRSVVRSRLRTLPPRARALLRDAAVLGTSFRIDDLATVRGDSLPTVLEDIRPAYTADLLVDDGPRATFRHALVRDAVYEDISSAVRATMHLHAGRQLAAAGSTAAEVAHHLAQGAAVGDAQALTWLARAAAEAAPRAPSLAVEHLQRALTLAARDDPRRRRLEASLARCLLWSGRLVEAGDVARRMLARPGLDGSEEADARFVLGRMLAYQGDVAAAISEVEQGLREGAASGIRRAQLLAELALRRGLVGDLPGADDAARRALVAGQELGDSLTVCTARCARSWSAALQGQAAEAVALAQRAVDQPAPSDPVEPVQSRLYLGFAQLHAGDVTAARATLEDASAQARELGARWAAGLAASLASVVGYLAGDWDEASAMSAEALTLAHAGGARTWTPLSTAVGALIAVARQDVATASALLASVHDESPGDDRVHVGAGLLELADAELRRVVTPTEPVDDLRRAAVRRDLSFGALVHLPVHAMAWAADGMSAADATFLLPHLEKLAGRSGGTLARAAAARSRAIVGDDPAASLAAETAMADGGLRYHHARMAEDAAVSGADPARTEQLAEFALASYRSLRASRDDARCRARLRDIGMSTGARERRQRPATGPHSLTPAERRVATLVAEGLSNPAIAERLFVSRRTVETHVSSALRKLGIASRLELALHIAQEGDANASR